MNLAFARYLVLTTLMLYLLIGLGTKNIPERYAYPFFSWSLFSDIPTEVTEYTIRIRQLNGVNLPEPKFFKDVATTLFQKKYTPIYYYDRIQDIGGGLEKQREVTEHLKALEAGMSSTATYDIVKIRYNPVEFWKTGASYTLVVLGSFSVKTP